MTRAWVRELAGWIGAVAVAIVVVAQVAASARSELLFRDGDSLIVPLLARSLLEGDQLDWALSSVLFLPETAVFALLRLVLPWGVEALLLVNATLNLIALYGGFRLVAGRRREGTAPVVWSLLALGMFGALAMTDASASRNALELASLLLTTSYYSATVIAVVVTVGLARRITDRPESSRAVGLFIALALVAVISTLSNPLYAAWATVPLAVVLGIAALRIPARRRMLTLLGVLAGGTIAGLIVRIPFGEWIANSGVDYVQPGLWPESASYYLELLGARLSTPLGIIGSLMTLALLIFAVRQTARVTTRGERLVAAAAWMLPLVVVIGAVALGTHAARYLQPLAFAPLLALVAAPRTWGAPRTNERRDRRALAVPAAAALLLLVGAGLSVPRAVGTATAHDADLSCVTDWVDESGRTGAGQFWTVRLPKLHLEDPSQLVQVDYEMRGYAWLVNRTDFSVGAVSFLVEDEETANWAFGQSAVPTNIIDCGRYSIYDFEPGLITIGPSHS